MRPLYYIPFDDRTHGCTAAVNYVLTKFSDLTSIQAGRLWRVEVPSFYFFFFFFGFPSDFYLAVCLFVLFIFVILSLFLNPMIGKRVSFMFPAKRNKVGKITMKVYSGSLNHFLQRAGLQRNRLSFETRFPYRLTIALEKNHEVLTLFVITFYNETVYSCWHNWLARLSKTLATRLETRSTGDIMCLWLLGFEPKVLLNSSTCLQNQSPTKQPSYMDEQTLYYHYSIVQQQS